jgi:hypothetical protein
MNTTTNRNGERQRGDGTWTHATEEWDTKWYWPVGTRVFVRSRGLGWGTVTKQNSVTVVVTFDAGQVLRADMRILSRTEGK